jgi:hypothetical protein
MKRFILAAAIALCGFAAVTPAQAHDHVSIGVGFGGYGGYGCCGRGYYPYYPAYYPPAYYAYPTYYAPPPTVVYAQPTYYDYPQPAPAPAYQPAPQPQVAPPAPSAPVTASTDPSTDSKGRTCRAFQSAIDGAPVTGTACLQPDGSWRTIGE